MDKSDAVVMYWAVGMTFIFSFGFGMMIGVSVGQRMAHQEAVKAGVARWSADADGAVKFEWTVPSEKKP